jgi:hypothetical protein
VYSYMTTVNYISCRPLGQMSITQWLKRSTSISTHSESYTGVDLNFIFVIIKVQCYIQYISLEFCCLQKGVCTYPVVLRFSDSDPCSRPYYKGIWPTI